jgi:hypothetical protein
MMRSIMGRGSPSSIRITRMSDAEEARLEFAPLVR